MQRDLGSHRTAATLAIRVSGTPTSRSRRSPAGAAERMQEEAQSAQILHDILQHLLAILRRVKSSFA